VKIAVKNPRSRRRRPRPTPPSRRTLGVKVKIAVNGPPSRLRAARLAPLRWRNWPVRWQLAGVSTVLTLAILLIFGVLIGKLSSERIRGDFDDEVRGTAHTIASELQIYGTQVLRGPRIENFVLPDDAALRVYTATGTLVRETSGSETSGAASLGIASRGLTTYEGMRVATVPLVNNTGYLQYGRSLEKVESTINRLWLLIAAGVLGGTLLASFAGVAIARRAMQPISTLTATARQVADTGDPSRRVPVPNRDDEVGELARTLEQMLRSLDAARAEREQALRRQREFIADASHELRTPLTSIIANLELLQASLHGRRADDDGELADSALRSSQRMSRLVADLLLLARADAGRIGTHHRVDLAEVGHDAAAEAAPMLGERRLSVDDPPPLWIEGNPDELHRLVLNLLDNAARHTPEGSAIELHLREEDGSAVLEVADDGPGIPAAARDQIFERFVRGEGSADIAVGPGTGLGLSIVRAVATAHDGTAEVTQSSAGGALFRVRLPLAKNASRAGDAGSGVLAHSLRGRGPLPRGRTRPPKRS
jgi:two-component system, OmpR family, sensor kinase